jgi:DNA repair exonuclease SbcCD ATPase subunit
MSIHFTKVRWKNFLSTGNAFTEIQLDRSTTTLILGENGFGKSTILDSLCFALFGKAFRNINKPALVNCINQKNCLVEVEFRSGNKNYKVCRGIKPNIFSIYCNDELVNQDAATKDYQLVLEEQILKFNYKAFTQIDILGSASFTPFMQLPLAHRREVIEDILDIQIFSTMNTLLKEKLSNNKDSLRDIDIKIEFAKQKAKLQKEFIQKIEHSRDKKHKEIQEEIEKTTSEIDRLSENVDNLLKQVSEKMDDIKSKDSLDKKQESLITMKTKLVNCYTKLSDEIEFYNNNNNCPTCKQKITKKFKSDILKQKSTKHIEVDAGLKKIEKDLTLLQNKLLDINNINIEINALNEQIQDLNTTIATHERYLKKLRKDIEKPDEDLIKNLDIEKQKLKDIAKEVINLAANKTNLKKDQEYLNVCAMLLKDTGIKTKIIKQYLPIINKTVNKYLAAMDFFVHFELDEAFNEQIKSRHRDGFSYASFSEGEKQRIDLALLFTWRTIAKLKNSVHTNLLILDEIFDSSLDNNGTDYLMSLLNTLGTETNLFVISHKGDALYDKFRSVIRFEKQGNFSVLR